MWDNPILSVIQPKESLSDAGAPRRPQYRFSSSPPATVSLKVRDFASAIPEAARRETFSLEREVFFSCAEIFQSPTPKIRLGRLAELMPGAISAEGQENLVVPLPPAHLAQNFRFLVSKELLDGPGGFETPPQEEKEPAPASATEETAPPTVKEEKKETFLSRAARLAQKLFVESRPEEPAPPTPAPVAASETPPEAPEKSVPLPPPAPAAMLSLEKEPETPKAVSVRAFEIEHLPAEGVPEIPDPNRLQQLFMTEEDLSVRRVVELCGTLPGIASCILANGPGVITSTNVPASVDFVALSGNALEMLDGMRNSAAKMGLGSIPAVTIHSEKGPVSFINRGSLSLLVLHKDRAFVPGVREKLQEVLAELAKANLPRAVSSAALAEK